MAEQAKPMGGGTESLTRQDRLLWVLVENYQPVWREIDEAGVFRRRGLASRDGLLVPQNVMIGLVMLRGLLSEAGHDVLSWAELAASRETDRNLGRQFAAAGLRRDMADGHIRPSGEPSLLDNRQSLSGLQW